MYYNDGPNKPDAMLQLFAVLLFAAIFSFKS